MSVADFEEVFALRPQVIVCNVEFLSSKKVAKGSIVILKLLGMLFQVRDVILDLSLSPSRQPPIVCIDETQVSFWKPGPMKCFSAPTYQNWAKSAPQKCIIVAKLKSGRKCVRQAVFVLIGHI